MGKPQSFLSVQVAAALSVGDALLLHFDVVWQVEKIRLCQCLSEQVVSWLQRARDHLFAEVLLASALSRVEFLVFNECLKICLRDRSLAVCVKVLEEEQDEREVQHLAKEGNPK